MKSSKKKTLGRETSSEALKKEGIKFDSGKIRLELIPPEFLYAVGDILTYGAKKYDDHNWARGMSWTRVYGALQRHLNAWLSGEDLDPETGKSHLWHASCNMAFLVTYEKRQVGVDDRWSKVDKKS